MAEDAGSEIVQDYRYAAPLQQVLNLSVTDITSILFNSKSGTIVRLAVQIHCKITHIQTT